MEVARDGPGGVMSDQLINAKEAAELLGVSVPTFRKIREQYKLTPIAIGARTKFSRSEILRIAGGKEPLPKASSPLPEKYTVFSDNRVLDLETERGIFDLRSIKLLDPYGVVSLLCTLIHKCNSGQNIELLIEDNRTTKYLKSIGFFDELQAECKGKIGWDKALLKGSLVYEDETTLVPIRGIKLKGNERLLAEKLIELLKKQGFSLAAGRKIAHILGELADNALTHSNIQLSERKCFILANRFLLNETNCIIVGLADIGQGIHNSLKTNVKYQSYSNRRAFLEAFRPYVSSWDDAAKRGKGLADVLGISMGNHSYLRVDSGDLGLLMDFEAESTITFKVPSTDIPGTRYGIVLVDKIFDRRTREQVDELILKTIGDL